MTLSIVIVNWNTRALLQACLSSIFRHRPGFAFEVIIVDNGSRDGSPEMVCREFPQARLLENHANLGFAAASNRGAAIASGHYLLFLNSDTLVHDATLGGAVSYMEKHPGTGVMGCRTLNPDGSLQGTALRFPSLARIVAHVSGLSRFLKFSHPSRRLRREDFDYIQGSFLIIARSVFDLCDGFDESFFLYGEDVDLCLRVRKAGMRLAYDTAIAITHRGGGSSEDQVLRVAHFAQGCIRLYDKHRELAQAKKLAAFLKPALAIRGFRGFYFSPLRFRKRKKDKGGLYPPLAAARDVESR